MGKSKGLRRVGFVLLALALFVAAGCQAVGGLDFNETIKRSLKVTSAEGKQTVEFRMLLDEEELAEQDPEDVRLIRLLSDIRLEMDSFRMENENRLSAQGSLSFGDRRVGYSLYIDDERLTVELEGAKQPFVLDLSSLEEDVDGTAADQETMTELAHRLIDEASGYLVGNLPNPERLTVAPATETIGGEQLSLLRAEMEMNVQELWPWLMKYFDALIADKEGLRDMLLSVVGAMRDYPELWGGENPFDSDGLSDEEAAEQAADELMAVLKSLRDELNAAKEEGMFPLEMFSEETYLKAVLYVDSKLDIRKSEVEAKIAPNLEDTDGVKAIVIRSVSEMWNIGGSAKADAPDLAGGSLDAMKLADMQPYQLLRQFDEGSTLYGLLKNDFHIGRQSVMFFPFDDNPPIVLPSGVTLVPLRETARQFGATVTYKNKTVTVSDEATGTTIAIKPGSNQVKINGKTVKWAVPATAVQGAIYVPARDLAKALGGTVKWESLYGDEKLLVLEREV